MQLQRALKSVVKPAVRGETLVVGNSFLTEVTIAAVDTNKAFVNMLGCRRSTGAAMSVDQFVEVDLKNATTLRFRRNHSGSASMLDVLVSWELKEYV